MMNIEIPVDKTFSNHLAARKTPLMPCFLCQVHQHLQIQNLQEQKQSLLKKSRNSFPMSNVNTELVHYCSSDHVLLYLPRFSFKLPTLLR